MRMPWLALVAALLVVAAQAVAAPAADPWPRWERYDAASTVTIDHSPFGQFLARHVAPQPDGSTRVTYARVDSDDRDMLAGYVAALESAPVSILDRDEQMAFWINLYNAVTLKTVLEHYPVGSIRDIALPSGPPGRGPWGAKLVTVEGESLSLDDIEHRILRPLWQDPRVHYALNYAAIGCPDLQPEPFTADGLDQQLDAAAIRFVNHPRGVRLEEDRLTVSSIYDWYREDFGGTERDVVAHLMAYAAPSLAMLLQKRATIDAYHYDWRLDDADAAP